MPNTTIIQPSGRKQNYLNNKDLLAEIHKSKASLTSYINKDHIQHAIILSSLADINEKTLEDAKRNRAKREGLAAFNAARIAGDSKIKIAETTPDYTTIDEGALVIRIMTFDHIPLAPGRKKTTKSTADCHEKVNFPPYQHFKIHPLSDSKLTYSILANHELISIGESQYELVCVGKSHWKGDLTTGKFSKDHGRISENLGRMFIKLSERYAQRSNWRGYTYVDEMRGQAVLQLSQIGLQFDESKSENPFAYYTAAVTNSFTRILNLEKKMQNIRDDMLEGAGLTPSLTRQSSQEFAEENAKQAELYKKLRMPKTDEVIEDDNTQDN